MEKIKMDKVNASNIARIGYDCKAQQVYILFSDGSLYRYNKVPSQVYEDLKKAPSIGSYLHRYIKGNYSFEKVEKVNEVEKIERIEKEEAMENFLKMINFEERVKNHVREAYYRGVIGIVFY